MLAPLRSNGEDTKISRTSCRLKDGAHCDCGKIGNGWVLTNDADLGGYISVADATLVPKKYVAGIGDFDKLQL